MVEKGKETCPRHGLVEKGKRVKKERGLRDVRLCGPIDWQEMGTKKGQAMTRKGQEMTRNDKKRQDKDKKAMQRSGLDRYMYDTTYDGASEFQEPVPYNSTGAILKKGFLVSFSLFRRLDRLALWMNDGLV